MYSPVSSLRRRTGYGIAGSATRLNISSCPLRRGHYRCAAETAPKKSASIDLGDLYMPELNAKPDPEALRILPSKRCLPHGSSTGIHCVVQFVSLSDDCQRMGAGVRCASAAYAEITMPLRPRATGVWK